MRDSFYLQWRIAAFTKCGQTKTAGVCLLDTNKCEQVCRNKTESEESDVGEVVAAVD